MIIASKTQYNLGILPLHEFMILEKHNMMRIHVVVFHLAPMSDLIACCLFLRCLPSSPRYMIILTAECGELERYALTVFFVMFLAQALRDGTPCMLPLYFLYRMYMNLHEFTCTIFLNGQLDRRRWTFAAQPEWMGIVASTLHAANALCFLSGKEYQRISKNGELMETVSSQFHHVSFFVTFQYISAEVQSAILKRGLTILKPSGLLLYSTCSMSPIENEAVVAAAMEK